VPNNVLREGEVLAGDGDRRRASVKSSARNATPDGEADKRTVAVPIEGGDVLV